MTIPIWPYHRRKAEPLTPWVKQLATLTDDPATPFPALRDHIRAGLESVEVADQGAALMVARGIAVAMYHETGDGSAMECLDRLDWPGFLDAWERGEELMENTVESTARPP